jgi:glycosyltransferase involved in cell wall biosynthesis
MKRPTMSLLVPTHREDRPLQRCLESVQGQLKRGDEVIVIGDTHDGPLDGVEEIVKRFGHQYRYLPIDAGHHCWGHCQLDAAIAIAQGDYIHCNDDDDIWATDALETFRTAASGVRAPVPFLFRFRSYVGPVFWVSPGLFGRNMIGGHCLLAPREKAGHFTCQYTGDFDYVESTVNKFGGPGGAVWNEAIVAIARPA